MADRAKRHQVVVSGREVLDRQAEMSKSKDIVLTVRVARDGSFSNPLSFEELNSPPVAMAKERIGEIIRLESGSLVNRQAERCAVNSIWASRSGTSRPT